MALHERPQPRTSRSRPAAPTGGSESAGPDPQELALLERARGGDQEALREILEAHQDWVFRLMLRMFRCDRDTGADLAQEVFLRVFRGLAGFDGQARLSTWIHKIAVNVGITHYRRKTATKRNKKTLSLQAPIAGTDDLTIEPPSREIEPSEGVHHREFVAAVRTAVHDLPDEFRDAVVLRDLQNLSYEEIGALLAIPAGTVRSRIHRGRLILQEKLREFLP